MLRSILTLVLIYLIYFFSHNIALTIVGGIAVILIMKSLEPYFKLLEAKIFPMPPIKPVREQNMVLEPGKGVRIMVVTQFTEFHPKKNKSLQLYDQLVAEAVEKLKEKEPIFAIRYDAVCERQLPMQYTFSVCGEKGSGMRKCYSAWLKAIVAKDFGAWKEHSELFIYDGVFNDPENGEPRSSCVLFMFDSALPKTVVKSSENPVEYSSENPGEGENPDAPAQESSEPRS